MIKHKSWAVPAVPYFRHYPRLLSIDSIVAGMDPIKGRSGTTSAHPKKKRMKLNPHIHQNVRLCLRSCDTFRKGHKAYERTSLTRCLHTMQAQNLTHMPQIHPSHVTGPGQHPQICPDSSAATWVRLNVVFPRNSHIDYSGWGRLFILCRTCSIKLYL